MMGWRAWHIFMESYQSLDRLLGQAIRPEIARLISHSAISCWFFLRYWENGPHIRIRLRDIDDVAFGSLGDRLRVAAAAIVTDMPTSSRHIDAGTRFDGWHLDPSILPAFDPGSVHEIMYEPEWRRYGGVEGLSVNEEWFALSSRLALQIINATIDDWPRREAVALRLTAVTIASIIRDRSELVRVLSQMAEGWRSFLPDPASADNAALESYQKSAQTIDPLFKAMVSGSTSTAESHPVVTSYARIVSERLDQLRSLANGERLISPLTGIAPRTSAETQDALRSIVMSQVHMTNNRLGLSPGHEYHFARMLLCAADVHTQ